MTAWLGDADTRFTQAVRELTQERQTDGLIIDFRFNAAAEDPAPPVQAIRWRYA